jgi:ATP-dependent protease ClpP protease subunit
MITKVSVPQGLVENNEDGIPTVFSPMVITINAFGEISASQFAAAFNSVVNSPQKFILISINSPGGSVFELNQMRDLIVNSEKPVIGFGGGMVFSAASILLTSCTKGHRWMSPSSKLMIHEVATSSEGKSSDIISDALETEKLNDELFEILAKNRNPSYTSTNTGAAYITEIMNSRRLELWGEGFRWFDLKRLNLPVERNRMNGVTVPTANVNHVASVINSTYIIANTDPRWQFKIPRQEIDSNPLCKQNQ